MLRHWLWLVLAGVAAPASAAPDLPPPDRLERVVIVMRHGVRSAMSTPEQLGRYSAKPWPHFAVPAGNLTANGTLLLTELGSWYRRHYRDAGLLVEEDCSVYYWANRTQRTEATAAALAKGLTPGCPVNVHTAPQAPDPLFDAPLTPLAPRDDARLLAAFQRAFDGDIAAWDARQRPALDRFEALMLQCRGLPCTPAERQRVQRRFTDTPAELGLDHDGHLHLASPSHQVAGIAESLLMAYADGLDFLGWHGINAPTITGALQIHGIAIEHDTRIPELGRQTSTYLAMRLLATLQRGAHETAMGDPIGNDEKIIVLSGHDGTLTMLAGLLGIDWHLRDYGPGEAAPGGGLIFEVWRRGTDAQQIVRMRYVAQGLDQMRHRTALIGREAPLSQNITMAGCDDVAGGCPLAAFTRHVLSEISPD